MNKLLVYDKQWFGNLCDQIVLDLDITFWNNAAEDTLCDYLQRFNAKLINEHCSDLEAIQFETEQDKIYFLLKHE